MISRINRFRGQTGLRYVYKNGRSLHGQYLLLKFVKNTKRTKFRCAVVVSRRIHKSAVVRNQIRRRIYETVRLASQQIDEPYDMVFTVMEDQVIEAPSGSLEKEVKKLLAQAGITDKVKPNMNVMIEPQEK